MSATFEDALRYHDLGWSVIPIRNGTKKPAVSSWKPFQTRRADRGQLEAWFRDEDRGIAVVLGSVSGDLVCRDFDRLGSYDAWADTYPNLATTLPTVETGRGRHVYCRGDVDTVRYRSPSGSGMIPYEDGELRAGECYCVLPPSRHESGRNYRESVAFGDDVPWIELECSGLFGSPRETESTESNREKQSQQRTTESTEKPLGLEGLPDDLREAVTASLPTDPHTRNKKLFELARRLKGIPGLASVDARELRPYLLLWHERARHIVRDPFIDTWSDFVRAWPTVKRAWGEGLMEETLERARDNDLVAIARGHGYDEDERVGLLIAVCAELQRQAGDEPFFLSARTAGEALDQPHTTAWRWMRALEADEILRVVERGVPGKGKATRFRYQPREL